MIGRILATGLAPTLLCLLAPLAQAQTSPSPALESCEVAEATGGEGGAVSYTMRCQPVVGGDITSIENLGGGNYHVTYGKGRPAYGGGPVYILRYGSEHGEIRYGQPLDGNTGTVNR